MSVVSIITKEYLNFPVWEATRGHVNVQWLYIAGPAHHWMWHSVDLAVLRRMVPAPRLSLALDLTLVADVWVSCP